jgi:hypothetical protein
MSFQRFVAQPIEEASEVVDEDAVGASVVEAEPCTEDVDAVVMHLIELSL